MTKTQTQISMFIRRLLFTAVVAVLGHEGAHAQQNNITGYNQVLGTWNMATASHTGPNRTGTGSPAGRDACMWLGESYFQTDAAAGQNVWYCTALPGTWTNNGGAGSLTSFSAGTLSPLFTTSVATATTTPALSFILSNFSADNIFGNFTGSSAAPSTQAIPACANDGSHALVYPSHTFTCEAITTFTWPSAGIMVSTGSAAGASLTTTSGLEGFTFTAGVPSLTALGTAATSNSSAFQPAITGVANEVFGGTGPGMIALTSSYLPLSSMGTITGGAWSGSVIAGAYGGTGVANTGFTLTLGGNVDFTGAFNPTFSIPSSSTWTFQSGGGTLAQTGADINGSNQVTSTHLSSPLPFSQGGLGTSTNFAAHNWFGNSTGSTAAPSAQQPTCADLSNAANSCSTDATNAGNISAGTLSYGRLPTPAGGGPAGVVAVLNAATGAISNTATQVIGYTVPTGTFATGTTYTIEAYGSETTSTSPGNDTFSIEIGSTSLSGNVVVSDAPAAAASVSGSPIWIRGTITIFPSTVSGALTVCATSSGALSGTCKIATLNTATITAGQSNVLELVYQSGASTSSINFSQAKIALEKP